MSEDLQKQRVDQMAKKWGIEIDKDLMDDLYIIFQIEDAIKNGDTEKLFVLIYNHPHVYLTSWSGIYLAPHAIQEVAKRAYKMATL